MAPARSSQTPVRAEPAPHDDFEHANECVHRDCDCDYYHGGGPQSIEVGVCVGHDDEIPEAPPGREPFRECAPAMAAGTAIRAEANSAGNA